MLVYEFNKLNYMLYEVGIAVLCLVFVGSLATLSLVMLFIADIKYKKSQKDKEPKNHINKKSESFLTKVKDFFLIVFGFCFYLFFGPVFLIFSVYHFIYSYNDIYGVEPIIVEGYFTKETSDIRPYYNYLVDNEGNRYIDYKHDFFDEYEDFSEDNKYRIEASYDSKKILKVELIDR